MSTTKLNEPNTEAFSLPSVTTELIFFPTLEMAETVPMVNIPLHSKMRNKTQPPKYP